MLVEEFWKPIDDFPMYEVSNFGQVCNTDTGRLLQRGLNVQGCLQVGLRVNGFRHNKSIKVLVANAFVEGRTMIFDTPIHLDGEQENVDWTNLVWRPRWFAFKYSAQFKDIPTEYFRTSVVELFSGNKYKHIYDAAISNGLLFLDVRRSIYLRESVFPFWQEFGFL
jgi:NUMOD4 motif